MEMKDIYDLFYQDIERLKLIYEDENIFQFKEPEKPIKFGYDNKMGNCPCHSDLKENN